MEQARLESIKAITASMEAHLKLMHLEGSHGLMTAERYKKEMTLYHNQRIEREILLGNLPPNAKPKPKFRNGLYTM